MGETTAVNQFGSVVPTIQVCSHRYNEWSSFTKRLLFRRNRLTGGSNLTLKVMQSSRKLLSTAGLQTLYVGTADQKWFSVVVFEEEVLVYAGLVELPQCTAISLYRKHSIYKYHQNEKATTGREWRIKATVRYRYGHNNSSVIYPQEQKCLQVYRSTKGVDFSPLFRLSGKLFTNLFQQ